MSLNYTPQTVTADLFERLFEQERSQAYPAVDALEQRLGEAVDRQRLEAAGRVLACPMKALPPNWQHGRVIYAVSRQYLKSITWTVGEHANLLDIGTAKGFSALCLAWSAEDFLATVTSVDVMPPNARVRRNTIAEVDGLRTLEEILQPWPQSKQIRFEESTGIDWLKQHQERVHVAFVDGKHTDDAVFHEGRLLSDRQITGDVVIFDDYQVSGVAAAINRLANVYELEHLTAKPGRTYVIARRR